jgi:ferric-dicitrate binding protein FerR (iron transport regulator)
MSELPREDAEYLEVLAGATLGDPARERAARLLALAESALPAEPALDVEEGWRDLSARLTVRRTLRRLEWIVGVAAIVVFGIATSLSVAPVIAAHVDERYVGPATVRLPDGSRAELEPLARVHYRASFFRPPRSVELEGEARFLVRPDRAHPFEVHAGGAVVTAVGTIFTVRANPWEPTVRVSVEQGTVLVAPDRVLHAGDTLTVR